jgi:hypothetical protein
LTKAYRDPAKRSKIATPTLVINRCAVYKAVRRLTFQSKNKTNGLSRVRGIRRPLLHLARERASVNLTHGWLSVRWLIRSTSNLAPGCRKGPPPSFGQIIGAGQKHWRDEQAVQRQRWQLGAVAIGISFLKDEIAAVLVISVGKSFSMLVAAHVRATLTDPDAANFRHN